jgi:hypothetical protein
MAFVSKQKHLLVKRFLFLDSIGILVASVMEGDMREPGAWGVRYLCGFIAGVDDVLD